MKLKSTLFRASGILAFAMFAFFACKKDLNQSPSVTSDAVKKTSSLKYDPVTISCNNADKTTIDLRISAGASGAPAGFSIQWMTQDALDALGGVWPSSDDPNLCKASFSGKAYGNNYALFANTSIIITLGDLLAEFDNGGAIKGNNPGCEGALVCGTRYAFRAFAHADNIRNRSEFSFGTCETASCDDGSCSRHWYGYWKTHTEEWPNNPFGEDADKSAVYMYLGTQPYTAEQIENILLASPNGNGLIILAHQLISAKLNLSSGSNDYTIEGDNIIGNKIVPPTNSSTADLKYNTINLPQLVGDLHKFNNCNKE